MRILEADFLMVRDESEAAPIVFAEHFRQRSKPRPFTASTPDPVRTEPLNHITDVGEMVVCVIAVIGVALATVKVRATTPAGLLDIGSQDDAPSN